MASNFPDVKDVNILGGGETLCWSCKKAVKQCPWSLRFEPVKGWDAKKTEISYFVRDCPLFECDRQSPKPKPTSKKTIPRSTPTCSVCRPISFVAWSAAEERTLLALYRGGKSYKEISDVLGRSSDSISKKLRRLVGTKQRRK